MRWISYIVAASLGLLLDLGTKEAAWRSAALDKPGSRIVVVDGWFDLVRSENQGAAWGLLWGAHTFFLIVSIVAFLAITYFVHTSARKAWKGPVVLGLVLAGVGGNFFDRAMYGHVRDFLDWHTPDVGSAHDLFEKVFGKTHWPTFNVADIFICIGAAALVILFWNDDKAKKAAAAAPLAAPPAAPQAPPVEGAKA
ncbi:MAG: signal peptidase II [Planctomycetota bacterium]